VNNLAMVFL